MQSYNNYGVAQRRHLHQYPELGREEHTTSAHCQQELKKLGYTITPCFHTGFYADLIVNDQLPMTAFRADMDALPAQEKSSEPFRSLNDGVAHLCGHDLHMAVVLTAAKIIADHSHNLNSNIRLLFQPSEEMFRGGARGMIEAGCLRGVDQVYGLHNDPQIDCGSIAIRRGVMSSNGDQFTLTIEGKSAHATVPHLGLDTISEGCRFITAFKSIMTDRIDPNKAGLISTGIFNGGEASNIIAPKTTLEGSVRSFDNEVQKTMIGHVNALVEESNRLGFRTQIEYQGYPAIINHDHNTQQVITCARALLGESNVNLDHPPMVGSEDFSYFLQHKPGAFFFLGSGDHARGINNPIHSNPFVANENCILLGARLFAALVGIEASVS